eukprot:gene10858-12068_t
MSQFNSQPGAGWTNRALFQLGKHRTLAVPLDMHQQSRKKLLQLFHKQGIHEGVVLLEGGEQQYQYDSDTELVFRQDSWFQYLFGVKESGLFGAISLDTGKTTLFIPKLPSEYLVWCGAIYPPSHFQASYAVDEVLYVDDLSSWLAEQTAGGSESKKIHLMSGENSDSGLMAKPAHFANEEKFYQEGKIETAILYNLLAACRVIKNHEEVEVMRYASWVASQAHVQVMRSIQSTTFEYELEAQFLYEIYKNGGCRKSAYTSICACGPNSAVLHYGHAAAPNNRQLSSHDLALLDMGAEYHGYVSDITCSYPVSGKFSDDQRIIYEAVLNAQRAVYAHMLPGNLWTDCHLLAEKEILKALQQVGILHNGSLEDYANASLGYVFFPHGLGHLIGCDTHDVGAYIPGTPARSTRPGLNKLRTARVLEVGMVLTNEPGCYFVDYLLDNACNDAVQGKYINQEVLKRFRGFGGVRIEDVVLVTEHGPETLSTCPRTVQEIEEVMAGGAWPPAVDRAPELHRKWTRLAPKGLGMEELVIPVETA